MTTFRRAGMLAGLLAAACQTYAPSPVDLAEHARLFAQRVPDAAEIRAFAERLAAHDPTLPALDLANGVELAEARYVALLLNPSLRTARLRAGVAKASAAEAARWADPELSASLEKILESVAHPWLAGG